MGGFKVEATHVNLMVGHTSAAATSTSQQGSQEQLQ